MRRLGNGFVAGQGGGDVREQHGLLPGERPGQVVRLRLCVRAKVKPRSSEVTLGLRSQISPNPPSGKQVYLLLSDWCDGGGVGSYSAHGGITALEARHSARLVFPGAGGSGDGCRADDCCPQLLALHIDT